MSTLLVRRTTGSADAEAEAEAEAQPRARARSRLQWGVKRALDIVLAVAGIVVAAPIVVAVAAAIVLEDGGPVIFGQVRLGRDGRPFTMWKLRSMVVAADDILPSLLARNEAAAPFFKLAHDPRATRVGRWIRRLGIDELPQLVNVIRGEMSLVGPRPMLPAEHAAAPELFRDRLSVRPGLTGPCQVRGISHLSTAEHVRLDGDYARYWTLVADLTLLWRTLIVVGRSLVPRQRSTR